MNKQERQKRIDRMIQRAEIYEKGITAGIILVLAFLAFRLFVKLFL